MLAGVLSSPSHHGDTQWPVIPLLDFPWTEVMTSKKWLLPPSSLGFATWLNTISSCGGSRWGGSVVNCSQQRCKNTSNTGFIHKRLNLKVESVGHAQCFWRPRSAWGLCLQGEFPATLDGTRTHIFSYGCPKSGRHTCHQQRWTSASTEIFQLSRRGEEALPSIQVT